MSDALWRWYRGTRFARHGMAAPLVLGVASGLVFGPMWIGTAVPGYVVGRTNSGAKACAAGLFIGFAFTMFWLVKSMVDSGCPSCVDAVLVAPYTYLLLLVPFAVGRFLGQRAGRRFAALNGRHGTGAEG
jgi:hypothetical protein